jgi:hypothetical protein
MTPMSRWLVCGEVRSAVMCRVSRERLWHREHDSERCLVDVCREMKGIDVHKRHALSAVEVSSCLVEAALDAQQSSAPPLVVVVTLYSGWGDNNVAATCVSCTV